MPFVPPTELVQYSKGISEEQIPDVAQQLLDGRLVDIAFPYQEYEDGLITREEFEVFVSKWVGDIWNKVKELAPSFMDGSFSVNLFSPDDKRLTRISFTPRYSSNSEAAVLLKK